MDPKRLEIATYTTLLLAALLMVMVGCSTADIGRIRTSPEVTRQFEQMEVNPSYRYWYYNQENNPYGVVGLDREYLLDDDPFWHPVAPDSPIFSKVVGLVQSFPLPGSYTSGFAINDAQGRQIGVWYSSLGAGISVDPDAKRVSISTFMPWVFNNEF